MSDYNLETKCIHSGYTPSKGEPCALPVYQSTTYKYDTTDEMGQLFDLKADGYFYTRLQNPTNDAVAAKIADLEGGVAAILTSSGQAADFYAVFNICEAGDHVVAASTIYGGTFNLLAVTFKKLGIDCTFVDTDASEEEIAAAFKPNTKVLFAETIANPALVVLDIEKFARVALTCSGGPFFGMTRDRLETVTKADALKHPNWKMGAKITVDCATLMNKGLEVIEAMRLYRLPPEQVDVVIHRQSIVHSMVEFTDGAVMAQMGSPDMRLPIQLALTYPERISSPVERLDLLSCGPLTFSPPDTENFPCLALARDCAKAGGTACPAMNGANEEAVAMFLNDKIGFYDIYRLVNAAASQVPFIADPTLEQILEADRLAREAVRANS